MIIINGSGGAGKDTLCGFAKDLFRAESISAITPIKEIAERYGGWKGEKNEKSRRFLHDLKMLFVGYNDLPFKYLKQEYETFKSGEADILFVHIREKEEIEKFKASVGLPCLTLLVRRKTAQKWNNPSDDGVESCQYDYTYDNDLPLSEAKDDFLRFLRDIVGNKLRNGD